ncbi:hypothetical protein IWX46DRAFT_201750 [Phyllosticta citricarpa]|uniref:Uncharacterized protein n=1 Tax=Phyllosticta citricarpa TaxID=55181 RepID=A0ABR1LYJ1_9PEZI
MCQLKARKDAKKLFKKPFFAAQLKYHDIKFKSSRKVDDLRNLLEESIRQVRPSARLHLERDIIKTPLRLLLPLSSTASSLPASVQPETCHHFTMADPSHQRSNAAASNSATRHSLSPDTTASTASA